MRLDLWMTALHVSSAMVWVGAVVSSFVAASVTSVDDATRHVIARRLHRWVARPAFLLALGFGVIRLGMDWRHYFITTHFMHAKLTLAFLAIVAHHFIGARIRSSKSGRAFHSPATIFAVVMFGLSCLAAVVLVVVRPL